MTADELGRRLRLLGQPPEAPPTPTMTALAPSSGEICAERFGARIGADDAAGLTAGPLVPAAVLVGFLRGRDPSVLLTLRTQHLSKHAGQVSFPGGRIDPGDADAEHAALREAQEELALDPAQVELAGRLGGYVTGTGYRITPVLGLLPRGEELAGLHLTPSPAEVQAVFTLPLSVLLDPAAPERRQAEFRGRVREFWVWPHPTHYIWGATAAILVHLAERLRAARV